MHMLVVDVWAGADVVRPVPGHCPPGQLPLSAHSAQHGHRRRPDVADRVHRQQPAAEPTRRQVLSVRRPAAFVVHQRQHLRGCDARRRSALLRLFLRVRLRPAAVRHLRPVRATAASSAQ